MTALAIGHYRFRLRRRGWVRGDASGRVVAAARRRLPEMVVARLAEIWPDAAGEISVPVKIALRVSLRDLAAACESDDALATLVARLLPRDDGQIDARASVSSSHPGATSSESMSDSVADPTGPDLPRELVELLSEWHSRGQLAHLLELFTEPALEEWHHALLGQDALRDREPREASGLTVRDAVVPHAAPPTAHRPSALRRRIVAAIEVMTRLRLSAPHAPLVAAIDHALPLPAAAEHDAIRCGSRLPASRAHHRSEPIAELDRSIDSALPFLLLRPLHRVGFLDTVEVGCRVADHAKLVLAFATALAYKVLPAPERGWRRAPGIVAAAAAVAGLADPVDEKAIVALAEAATTLMSPCMAVLARSLAAGHDAARPWLVVASEGEPLLVDPEGLFPVCWGRELVTIVAGARAVVIDARAAAPELLAALDAAGTRFITDAPPTRHERWRRIRAGSALWTNDPVGADDQLARSADLLALGEDVEVVMTELAARPVALSDRGGVLDRNLAVVAGAALAALAQALWRDREPTSPILALRRLGDLPAHVRRRGRTIEVRLPVGPRRADLERSRCLGDVPTPWGRVIVS